MTSANAAETDLDVTAGDVDWGTPWKDDTKLSQAVFASFEVGQKLNFYLELIGSDYHQYRFDTGSWNVLPGQIKTDIGADTKVTLIVTQEIKNAIASENFELHGHGVRVTKVTKEDSDVLCLPDVTPDWENPYHLGKWDGSAWYTFKEKVTSACNIYLLVEKDTDDADFRISGGTNGGDYAVDAYPSAGYNHMQNMDVDGIVTVAITDDFIARALTVGDGYIAFWGNHFTIKGIATSKEALITKVPVTMGANGFATFSYPWSLELGKTDVNAYTASLSGNTLSFSKYSETVPGSTGLLLEGTPSTTYYIPVATTGGSAVASNALQPALSNVSLQSDPSGDYYFVMKKNSDPLTFSPISTSAAVTLPDLRAYVTVPSGVLGRDLGLDISFDEGNATGVADVREKMEKRRSDYFDLMGRKVAQPTKGLYIVNGKKVIIK